MKKSLRKVVLATMAAAMTTSAYGASAKIARFDDVATKFLIPTERQWKSAPAMQRPVETPKMSTYSTTLGPSQEFSFVTGPNGEEWIALQQNTVSTTMNNFFTKSEVTLYDINGEKKGQFTVEIPDGMNVNEINIGTTVTNRFFDTKSSSEELYATIHIIHEPGVTSFVTYIYDIATGEQRETSYDGYMDIVPYSNGYSTDYVGVLSRTATNDSNEKLTCYDVYKKATFSAPSGVLKHTFEIPSTLAEYQNGSVLNVYELEGSLYYVVSHYDEAYMAPESYEPPYDMVITEENNFAITVYDEDFAAINTIKIPVPVESGYVTQFGVGLYGYNEFTRMFWNDEYEYNIVVAHSTMEISSDSESIGFDVYDIDGNKVAMIADGVSDWFKLYDVPGQSEQMAFLSADGATMWTVDVPSCQTVTTFGSDVDGYAISTNIDRYQVGDTYQYVIGLPQAELIEEDYMVGYAWVNTVGEVENIDWINVGTGFQNWVPLVMGEVLNPYLFNTDQKREYMFILSHDQAGTQVLMDEIRVVQEDGTAVATYQEDADGIGDLGVSLIVGLDTNEPKLFMPFLNSSTDEITIMVEDLPFAMFAGGDGSETNPYQIASAGDLAMVARDTDAHYVVVNDIDMSDYGVWSAVPMFNGVLDGGNYTISNLYIADKDGSAGIFAMTDEGAVIKDLNIENVTIEVSADAYEAGVLVSNATSATIADIHVKDVTIKGDEAMASIGGLAGVAYLNTTITECSVIGLTIDTPYGINVGGIAGATGTSTIITACATQGSIYANGVIGGITGQSGTGCAITDCHVNMAIAGSNKIGGVVGTDSRGGISRCYVEGELTATSADTWNGYAVGGVAGWLEPTFAATEGVITNNVVALESITIEGGEAKTAHRIVGYSRYDADLKEAQWDSSIVPTTEAGLANNFVVEGLAIVDATIADENTTTEGATIATSELGKAFFEGLGFKYGTDAENPWNTESDAAPYLYYEDPSQSGIEDVTTDKNKGIEANGSTFSAAGAVKIEVYNVAGVMTSSIDGDAIEADDLTTGLYVVIATYADGSKASAKVLVK